MDETRTPAPTGPLAGLRVLEAGHFVAAPFASRLLADYGAEVVKIEPPGTGDPLRALGDPQHGPSLWWSSLGRNKKSVTLDLRTRRGQELFLALAARSDVVIENFRVGQLEKWNVGWERIHAANPKTSLVRISGFGQSGPYKDRVAFAPTGEAFGGLRYLTRDPAAPDERPPIRTSLSLGDSIAGLFATIGALAALLGSRVRGDPGRCVDVAMYESVFALLESAVSEYGAGGIVRGPAGSAAANLAPSNTYRCADGTWACLTSTSDRLFARLCQAMGQPELTTDLRFRSNTARAGNRDALDAIIAAWTSARSYAQVEKRLLAAAVPVSRIFSVKDCVEDPHYQYRKSVIAVPEQDGRITLQPNIFPSFGGEDAPAVRWPGPVLGQHNTDVFAGLLGLSRRTLATLTREGVI